MYKERKTDKPVPVIDCHLDLGMYTAEQRRNGRTHVIRQDFLQDMRDAGVSVVVAACYLSDEEIHNGASAAAREQIEALRMEEKECPEDIAICENYGDILNAIKKGKLAIVISFEGVEPIEGRAELLDEFYAMGVRSLGIAWSRNNFAAEGAPYTAYDKAPNGLSDIGKDIIRRAADMGYIIDVTHLNDPGVDDIIAMGIKPVIASHSNCRTLNPTPRNIDDAHLRAIADTGGVICFNQVSAIVADEEEDVTIQRLVDHIDWAKSLVGVEHIGIGFDFCDCLYLNAPDTTVVVNGKKIRAYDLLKGYKDLGKLQNAMMKRGYSSEEIHAIFGGNMMSIFEKLLK